MACWTTPIADCPGLAKMGTGKKWSPEEHLLACKSYVEASLDPVRGSGQKKVAFFMKIEEIYARLRLGLISQHPMLDADLRPAKAMLLPSDSRTRSARSALPSKALCAASSLKSRQVILPMTIFFASLSLSMRDHRWRRCTPTCAILSAPAVHPMCLFLACDTCGPQICGSRC